MLILRICVYPLQGLEYFHRVMALNWTWNELELISGSMCVLGEEELLMGILGNLQKWDELGGSLADSLILFFFF